MKNYFSLCFWFLAEALATQFDDGFGVAREGDLN
jgi:hypothetical protein